MRGRGASVLFVGALAAVVVLAGAWLLRRERPRVAPLPMAHAQAPREQPPPELEPLADPAAASAPDAVRTVAERTTAERTPSRPRPRVTLEIALLRADGQPVREAAIGWLDFDPAARQFATVLRGGGDAPLAVARPPQRLLFQDGVATVAEVEAGQLLVLDVVTASGAGAGAHRLDWFAVEGAESRASAQVIVDGSFALHEWRALGQDGAPLAERQFELCRDIELFDDRQRYGSDAAGRLALLVALDRERAAQVASDDELHEPTRQRFALLAGAGDDARVAFAAFELPLHSAPGLHDEGTLAFDRGELIVAGRVVDEHGDRLGNVALEVRAEPGSRRGVGFVAALRAGADGSFEVRDVASPRELRVLAWDREGGRVAEEGDGVRASAGSRDVVVPMSRPAELRGRVVLPSGVAPESLRFQLTLQPAVRGVAESHAELDGERRLGARLTRRGNYRLDVLAESEGDPIATVGPIAIELGATIEPLELAPLDLSDRCRSLQVTVRRRDGSPVEGAVVWRSGMTMARRLTAAGAPPLQGRFARRVAVCDAAGRAALPIVAPAVDLVVVAPGCLPQAIAQVRDDLVVELEAQPTVRLDVAGVVAAGLDRAKLRVHLRPIAVPATLPSELLRALGNLVVEADADGELRAPLFAAGRFEARLYSIDGGSFEIGRGEFELATLDGAPSVALSVDPVRAAAAAQAAIEARARQAGGAR